MADKIENSPELRKALNACRTHLLVAAGFSALINLLYLSPTIYMMQVYDRVVPTGGVNTLIFLTLLIGLALGCLSALDMLRGRLMMRASLRLDRQLSAPIIMQVINRARHSNDPAARQVTREFDTLRQAIAGQGVSALFDLPWTPIYFLVAYMIHPLLGVTILFGGLVLSVIALLNERATRRSSQASFDAMEGSYSKEATIFSNSEIIRALGMRGALVSRHISERRNGLEASVSMQLAASRFSGLTKFSRMFMQSFALGVGAWLAINGEISVGAIIAASVLLSRALQPIEQVVAAWPTLSRAFRAWESMKRLFKSGDAEEVRTITLPDPEGYIRLVRVVIRTPDGAGHILGGVSTWLIPGETLALVGPSGSGKSTLARVAAGAIDCDGGQIRIDEAEYSEWDPDRLAGFMGYLPQNAVMLPGTVSENISRFAVDSGSHPTDVDRLVTEAAKAVGIHEMILHWPGGYNAQIGPGGITLSGGQAQRLSLARAIYGDPRVLILDEPDTGLDMEGETALHKVIVDARQRGAALLVISHRASFIGNADRVAVMKQGMIDRQGPRDEVLQSLREASARAANVVDIKKDTAG